MHTVMSWIKVLSLQIVLLVLFLEVGSFVLSKANLLLVNDTPSVYTASEGSSAEFHAGRAEEQPWGAWRAPNAVYRHFKSCFDVEISTNEIGARDASFSDLVGSSIFLIGDSFAEGFGVAYHDTSQYLLEQKLDKNILNFGSAGDFGPLQELLIYHAYKEKYPHDGVLVYILPANDFMDNDANVWKEKGESARTRYRPYFSEGEDPLIPWYFPAAEKRSDSLRIDARPRVFSVASLKTFVVDHLWMSNVLRSIKLLLSGEAKFGFASQSQYYDSELYQQKKFIQAYSKLVDLAANKGVLFVVIPDAQDIRRFLTDPDPSSYKKQFWYQGLSDLAAKSNVALLDLMDHVPESYNQLFLSCDGHWSPRGNMWAADIIEKYLSDNPVLSR